MKSSIFLYGSGKYYVLYMKANCFCVERMLLGLFLSLPYSLGLCEHEFVTSRHFHVTDEDFGTQREEITCLGLQSWSGRSCEWNPGHLTYLLPNILFSFLLLGK